MKLRSPKNAEPRWPALVALLGTGALYAALPSSLLLGGLRWLLPVLVVSLLVPTEITHHIGQHQLNQTLGFILNGVVTFCGVR